MSKKEFSMDQGIYQDEENTHTLKEEEKQLAEVFNYWQEHTDYHDTDYEVFDECVEGLYRDIDEYIENDLNRLVEFCGLTEENKNKEYWKTHFENEIIKYEDEQGLWIIRKRP